MTPSGLLLPKDKTIMNAEQIMFGVLIAGLLAFTGCGKKEPQIPAAYEIRGVKVDMPRLEQAFAGAGNDLQADVVQTASNIRYGQYVEALVSLDKLVNKPNLSDAQKKVVNEVIEEVKQLINKAGPSR